MRRAMSNSADLRGSQRLSLLCDFIGKQNPGFLEGLARGCLGFLPAGLKRSRSAEEETSYTYSPSYSCKIKRALLGSLKPKSSPREGIELSWLAIIKAIGLPL